MLFFVSFMPFLGSGPIFDKTIESWLSPCYLHWWSTILHIATYTNISNLCLNWTWYLSGEKEDFFKTLKRFEFNLLADFQLFVLSPLLIYPAWRWRWSVFAAFPVALLTSVLYIFITSFNNIFFVFVGPL